jgi:hypothetical protein
MINRLAVALALLAAVVLLAAGCGGSAGNPYQHPVGEEAVAGPDDPLRVAVLDIIESERVFYLDHNSSQFNIDSVSKAGQYVTVWVALKNTGASPRKFGMGGGRLRAGGAVYYASGTSIEHPRLSDGIIELPPKDLTVVSLYFDVPADADPERLNTSFWFPLPSRNRTSVGWPVTFDLTRSTLGDVPPTWWLALQLELINAREYDLAYMLFDSASREQFTADQYAAGLQRDPSLVVTDYAFRDTQITPSKFPQDRASTERVLRYTDNKTHAEGQDVERQEFVRENGLWRIVAGAEQQGGR